MSEYTKPYEDKMTSAVRHLEKELAAVRAGRANPAVLDKIAVDYYGTPTPIQQVAAVAVAEARVLTITPWPCDPSDLPGPHRGPPPPADQGRAAHGRGGQGGRAQCAP